MRFGLEGEDMFCLPSWIDGLNKMQLTSDDRSHHHLLWILADYKFFAPSPLWLVRDGADIYEII